MDPLLLTSPEKRKRRGKARREEKDGILSLEKNTYPTL